VTPSFRRILAAFAVLIAAGVAAWLLLAPAPRPSEPVEDATQAMAAPVPPPAASPAWPAAPPAPRPPPPPVDEIITTDGLPIMPPRATDPRPEGPVHPHPITPRHQRIFAENRLVGALNGAMDVKDVPGMRRLLDEYRRDYPEDDNMLHDGYAVIADCFERPGAASRAAAETWIASHNGSTLKRFVHRHCLD
jgi:hypothetical protein